MKRFLLAGVLAVAAGVVTTHVVVDSPPADAVTSGQVIGAYLVKLKGDGWAARVGPKAAGNPLGYHNARIQGGGRLEVAARDETVNDGLVTVRVFLDPATSAGILGGATTGTPAFEGTAAVIGDSISVIDAGQPNYVNVLTLRFAKGGRSVTGSWMAAFPALEADLATQKFATGVSVTVTGRRALRDRPQ